MSLNSNEIYEILSKEILNLTLKPGDILVESELCERFGVSRTPIRMILQMLSQKNLVETIPYKGTMVTLLDYDIISQTIYLRTALEIKVLEDFMSICEPSDIERIRYFLTEMESAVSQTPIDVPMCLDSDFQMHYAWFEKLSKSYLLTSILSNPSYARFCMLDVKEQLNMVHTTKDHQEIMKAIDKKDMNALKEIITKHLSSGIYRLNATKNKDIFKYFKHLDKHTDNRSWINNF